MRKFAKVAKISAACSLSAVMAVGLAACGNNAPKTDTSAEADLSDVTTVESDSSEDLEGAVGKIVDDYSGYLGYGYDVLHAPYYNEGSVKADAEVLDVDSLAANKLVRVADMNHTEINSYEAETLSEIYANLSKYSGLEVDLLFGGMEDYMFKNVEFDLSSEYYLKYYQAEVRTQRDIIKAKTSTLKDYLSEEFTEDIETMSAEDILDKYGSYVMTDIQNGGKFLLLYSYDAVEGYDAVDFYSYTDEWLGDFWDFDSAYSDDYSESDLESMAAAFDGFESTSIVAEGGKVTIDGTNPYKALNKYEAWADSVQNGKTAFINCTSGIWIWDLIDLVDSDKASEVKDAYTNVKDDVYDEVTEEYGEETSGEQSIDEVDNEGTM